MCVAILRAVGCVLAAVSHVYGARRSTIHEDLKGITHWYLVCSSEVPQLGLVIVPLWRRSVFSPLSGPLIHEQSSPRWLSYCLSTHVLIRREAQSTNLHNTLAGLLINVAVLGRRHLQGGVIWRGITGDRQRNNGGAIIEATTPQPGSTVCRE